MKLIKNVFFVCLCIGFFSTQLAYAQKGGKDMGKKIVGVWIAQGMIFKDAAKIPAQDKKKFETDLNAISQSIHNRLAFAFEPNGSFKAINANDNKKMAGTWKIKGKNLLLASQDAAFNKEFGNSEIVFAGEMLDMYLDFSNEDDIKKYKPAIRFQKGTLDELDFSPKQQAGERAPELKPETDSFEPTNNISDYVTYKSLTWAVAPTRVDCQRPDKEPCLQVRDDANKEWSPLSQKIEGFEHTEGFEYIIYVSERTFKNPPLAGSNQTVFYTLLKIVSKTKK